MKILMITHNYPRYRGDHYGKFIKDLCSGLRNDENVQVNILAPLDLNNQGSDDHTMPIRYYGGQVFYRGLAHYYRRPSSWIAFITFIMGCVNTGKKYFAHVDVINAHWWFPGGVAAYWLSKIIKKPYIITCHGTEISVALKKWYLRPLARFLFRESQQIIVVSTHLQQKVEILDSKLKPKIRVCSMPYDDNMFASPALPEPRFCKPINVIAIGNLIPRKGFDYLIRACAGLKDVNLTIYGNGSEFTCLSNLIARLQALNVFLYGITKSSEVPSILKNADVLVVPSVTFDDGGTEGFGMVILEAMASGTPVIATDHGGMTDIIKNNKNGLLVPEKDSPAICQALTTLIKDCGLREKIRNNGLITAENYTKAKIALKYIKGLKGE